MNFVGLSEGAIKNFVTNQPYFENIMFHRVVDEFVIQIGGSYRNGDLGGAWLFFLR